MTSNFAYCDQCYHSVVYISICLSVSHVHALCSNGKRYQHTFFCIQQPHDSPRLCKNLAYINLPLPPQISPQSDPTLSI